MAKRLIRLTEGDLHKIIKESVSKILNEVGNTPGGQRQLGRLANRKYCQGAARQLSDPSDNHAYDDFYDVDNYAENQRLANGLDDDDFLDGYGETQVQDSPYLKRFQKHTPEGGTGYYG